MCCRSVKGFVIDLASHLSKIFQLPLLASTSGDILEVFLVKHSLVCNQLGRFSFSSKTFKPEDRRKHSHAAGAAAAAGGGQSIGQVSAVNESLHQSGQIRHREVYFFSFS